jgi:DNA-binding GntR family transcriptional regulator
MADLMSIEFLEKQTGQPIHLWVYQVLRTNIIDLHLEPGAAISEPQISELLGVSRTPVREAFIRLAKDDLLVINPQKYSTVALIDLEQAKEARFMRQAVEKAVLREACAGLDPVIVRSLESNLETQSECRDRRDTDRFLFADNDFHRLIYGGCGHEVIWSIVMELDFNYDRLRVMTLPYIMDRVVDEHRRILEILVSGQEDAVDEALDRHLTWEVIREVVREYPSTFFKPEG